MVEEFVDGIGEFQGEGGLEVVGQLRKGDDGWEDERVGKERELVSFQVGQVNVIVIVVEC